jgi:hypothetical protein
MNHQHPASKFLNKIKIKAIKRVILRNRMQCSSTAFQTFGGQMRYPYVTHQLLSLFILMSQKPYSNIKIYTLYTQSS